MVILSQIVLWSALFGIISAQCNVPEDTVWCEFGCEKLTSMPDGPLEIITSGLSVAECQQQCLNLQNCQAINYQANKCELLPQMTGETMLSFHPMYTYYYYVCFPASCPEPIGCPDFSHRCYALEDAVWCEHSCQKLTDVKTWENNILYTNYSDCQQQCLEWIWCKAINYQQNQCQLLVQKIGDTWAYIDTDNMYTYYEYVCSPDTCAEPEPGLGCAEPAEEFWRWMRDEPQWFAMIGMGMVVILMVIITIVLKGSK